MITQQQTIAYPLTMSLDAGTLPNSDCPKRKANLQQEQGGECPSSCCWQPSEELMGPCLWESSQGEHRARKTENGVASAPFSLSILLTSWLGKPV